MDNSYTFIDLCAGIGWWRIWLEQAGFRCLGFSEIDKKAEYTYRTFFGTDEQNFWDLMNINPDDLPDFDLLIAGFPCQTFSIVGQRKGMEDPRGQVITGITNILKAKNTKYFILENVKGLVNHNEGKTMKEILQMLNEVWYDVQWRVLNSVDYGLPQSRERVYFLWIRKDLWTSGLRFPNKVLGKAKLQDYLIEKSDIYHCSKSRLETMDRYLNNKYNKGHTSIDNLLQKENVIIDTRQSDVRLYNGFSPTLRTGRHGLLYVKDWYLRELSWLEGLLLQGFPYELANKIVKKLSDKDLLSQAGNAMSVNVIQALWEVLYNFISSLTPNGSYPTLITNCQAMISKWIWNYRKVEQPELR